MKKFLLILTAFIVLLNTAQAKECNMIFEKGDKVDERYFTGTAWVNMLVPDNDNLYNTQVYV